MGYQFFLPMVLHWRASRAEAPLLYIYFFLRRLTSKEAGYVPANYVKEIEARTVKKVTKQKVVVPEKVLVKRRVKKKVMVQKQRAVKLKTPEKKGG